MHLIWRCYTINSTCSQWDQYTRQNYCSFFHTAQVLSELLECSEWHKCPLPRALTGVSSAPGEPLPQFSWTQMLLPTVGEHQGSPVWVQIKRFHLKKFISTGKAQKDRNVNQLFTCWTLTDVGTNKFCGTHMPRSKLQSQLFWCKPGQIPEVWKSLSLHQDKQKHQCALAETPSPLFLCCSCVAQHHNAQGPSVHTRGGGGGCCILEKHHIIYPTSKFSHYFYPGRTQPARSALLLAPVPAGMS